ncbi:MAG: competence/damage-inducible protein A [Salaquimonas sp.]
MQITAAMLAIGDELLSGRTKDKNIGYLAEFLTLKGIDLLEVRIVPDEQQRIVEALNALRSRYTYVFTSGGIGPTHDDITADAVAAAFDVPIDHDPRAMKLLEAHYKSREMEFTEARKRMARLPQGSDLIDNPVSIAPGFRIENVHVMAGVPSIFQAMMDSVGPTLKSGIQILSEAIECPFGEGTIGAPLGQIQNNHTATAIGSYPKFDGKIYSTQIVIRSRNQSAIDAAASDVKQMLADLAKA